MIQQIVISGFKGLCSQHHRKSTSFVINYEATGDVVIASLASANSKPNGWLPRVASKYIHM